MQAKPWVLRIRTHANTVTLPGLIPALTVAEFQKLLEAQTNLPPAQQEILQGFPPTVLKFPDDTALAIASIPGLRDGETLTVRRKAAQGPVEASGREANDSQPILKGQQSVAEGPSSAAPLPAASNGLQYSHGLAQSEGRSSRPQPHLGLVTVLGSVAESQGAATSPVRKQSQDTFDSGAIASSGVQQLEDDAALAQAIAASLADQGTSYKDGSFDARTASPLARPPSPDLVPGLPPGSMMVRRVVEADNSCLFNAFGYVLEGSRGHADRLRALIARTVADDPETFTEAFLERPNDEYCAWILDQSKWGGAIELSILAKHYQVEVAAYDVQSQRCDLYGEGAGFSQRVMLLFDGIHYDALALAAFPDAPEELDTTVFPSESDLASGAARSACAVVATAHAARAYTDTAGFTLRCGICQVGVKGENDAREHARLTGHQNFQEY